MLKILYICTHNRCRSILSEAITQQRSNGLLEAKSAGSSPSGEVHPLTIQFLEQRGYSVAELRSESVDEYQQFEPDLVITVCDSAANEMCPIWPGDTLVCHWQLEDPSKVKNSDSIIEAAFLACIHEIETRVDALTQIAFSQHTQQDLIAHLSSVGAVVKVPELKA